MAGAGGVRGYCDVQGEIEWKKSWGEDALRRLHPTELGMTSIWSLPKSCWCSYTLHFNRRTSSRTDNDIWIWKILWPGSLVKKWGQGVYIYACNPCHHTNTKWTTLHNSIMLSADRASSPVKLKSNDFRKVYMLWIFVFQ